MLFDCIYLSFLSFVNILWGFYGTCPITYYFMKYKKVSDIDFIIKHIDSKLYKYMLVLLEIITIISIYIVFIRSKILNKYVLYLFIFFREYFNWVIHNDSLFIKNYQNINYHNKNYIKVFNYFFIKMYIIFNIVILIYIFNKFFNNLNK